MARGTGAKGSAARIRVRVTIFCSDARHPVWPKLAEYCAANGFFLTNLASRLTGGEFLFLISCTQFVEREVRDRYKHVLVLHESDLPKGRGWSPVAHQVLGGAGRIVVSLIEAEDKIDSGAVWAKEHCIIPRHALADEILTHVFRAKTMLISRALIGRIEKLEQYGEPTYYKKRAPEDCELDPNKTIAEQFDLLRICEPRYPAFFNHRGHKYVLEVRRA